MYQLYSLVLLWDIFLYVCLLTSFLPYIVGVPPDTPPLCYSKSFRVLPNLPVYSWQFTFYLDSWHLQTYAAYVIVQVSEMWCVCQKNLSSYYSPLPSSILWNFSTIDSVLLGRKVTTSLNRIAFPFRFLSPIFVTSMYVSFFQNCHSSYLILISYFITEVLVDQVSFLKDLAEQWQHLK